MTACMGHTERQTKNDIAKRIIPICSILFLIHQKCLVSQICVPNCHYFHSDSLHFS